MPDPDLAETEWSYNDLVFGGWTKWNDVSSDRILLPDPKVDLVPKAGADGAWVYSHFLEDLAFTLSGVYAGEPDEAFDDMYNTWAVAFGPRDDDRPLYFHFPGLPQYSVLARPLKRQFSVDRLLSIGFTRWAVLMEATDATWIESDVGGS